MNLGRRIVDEEGKSVAMVVHDLNMALHYADYVVIMKDGNIVKEGSSRDVITAETVKDVYDVKTKIEDCGYVNPFV